MAETCKKDPSSFEAFVTRREVVRGREIAWLERQPLNALSRYDDDMLRKTREAMILEEKTKQEHERNADRADYETAKQGKDTVYGEAVLEIAKKASAKYDDYAAIKHKCERDPAFHAFLHGQLRSHDSRLAQAWGAMPSASGAALIKANRGAGIAMHVVKIDNSTAEELEEFMSTFVHGSARTKGGGQPMLLPSKLPLSSDEASYVAEPWWWSLVPSQSGSEVPWMPKPDESVVKK